MEPTEFLDHVEYLSGNLDPVNVEAAIRTCVDRAYYAAAHSLFNTIEDYIDENEMEVELKDARRARENLHTTLRVLLAEIESSLQKEFIALKTKRVDSTYKLRKFIPDQWLADSIEIAKKIIGRIPEFRREIADAYENLILYSSYWSQFFREYS